MLYTILRPQKGWNNKRRKLEECCRDYYDRGQDFWGWDGDVGVHTTVAFPFYLPVTAKAIVADKYPVSDLT